RSGGQRFARPAAGEEFLEPPGVVRLDEIEVEADLGGLAAVPVAAVAGRGGDEGGRGGGGGTGLLRGGEAVPTGRGQWQRGGGGQEDGVGPEVGGGGEGGEAVVGDAHVVAPASGQEGEAVGGVGVVIDDQDAKRSAGRSPHGSGLWWLRGVK